jgi:hypothetical protein
VGSTEEMEAAGSDNLLDLATLLAYLPSHAVLYLGLSTHSHFLAPLVSFCITRTLYLMLRYPTYDDSCT